MRPLFLNPFHCTRQSRILLNSFSLYRKPSPMATSNFSQRILVVRNLSSSSTADAGSPPKVPIVFSSDQQSDLTRKFNRLFLFTMNEVVEKNIALIISGVCAGIVGLAYFVFYHTDLLSTETYLYPADVDKYWYEGLVALKKGNRIEALESMHLAIEKCQKVKGHCLATYILLLTRGQLLEKHGLVDDAKEAYLRLVDFAKNNSDVSIFIYINEALNRLADLEVDDLGKKEKYFRQLLKISISSDYRANKPLAKDFVEHSGFAMKRSEDIIADNILKYGKFLTDQKLYDEALFLISEALTIAKQNDRRLSRVSSLYDVAGLCCWNLGKLEEAVEWGKKAMVHSNRFFNRDEYQFLYHLGMYLQQLGKHDEAKTHLTKALQLTPSTDESFKNQVSLLLSQISA